MVRLLEGRDTFYETGAGLQLGPHAVKILDRLGLASALNESAVAPEAILVRSARGRPIVRIPLGAYARARYGAPYWCLHRQDLHRALSDAVRAERRIRVDFGFRVAGVVEAADGVVVSDGAGAIAEGAGLVGADGLWSAIRGFVDPVSGGRERAAHSGWTAWRATLPIALCPPEISRDDVGLRLGPAAHIVHYPLQRGTLLNIVVVVRETFEAEGFDHRGDPALLEAALGGWSDDVRDLIRRVGQDWQRWALYLRPSKAPWARGRVLLAGDAAHPVLPFLAQGAALAIEDAWCIAAEVARTEDLPQAFQAVEARRRGRADAVVRASRRNAWAYHMGGLTGGARNWTLSCMGGQRLLSAYDWLYGYDETANRPFEL